MFFLLSVKRGAVSVNPKNPYQKILTFLTIFDHYLTIKIGLKGARMVGSVLLVGFCDPSSERKAPRSEVY